MLALALLSSCSKESKDTVKSSKEKKEGAQLRISKEEFQAMGLKLDSVFTVRDTVWLKLNGVVDVPPNNRAVISAFKGGFIKDIPVLVGDRVKKNQFLVRLENLEFLDIQKNYLEAGHDLKYLEAEYHRQKQLYEERISSEKKFQQAENAYNSKLLQRRELKEVLRMLHLDPDGLSVEQLRSTAPILSPFDGSISNIYVHSGVHVSPGEPILEVINTDHIHIELKVFEKDAAHLKLDQQVNFRVPEFSSKVFFGKVYRIGTVIQEDRTLMAHVHLDEEMMEKFMPGMYVEAEILTGESEQKRIGVQAAIQTDFKFFAFELVEEEQDHFVFERRVLPVKGESDSFYLLEENSGPWNGKLFLIGAPDQLSSL